MKANKWIHNVLSALFIFPMLFSLVFPTRAAATRNIDVAGNFKPGTDDIIVASAPDAQVQQTDSLSVEIKSTPYAILDSNQSATGPRVFVVQAAVTNNGQSLVEDLLVKLDYRVDETNGWTLLAGEDPERSIPSLAPGETYNAYWFATYSLNVGATHDYSVYVYDNPITPELAKADAKITTVTALSTGTSGILSAVADVVVGSVFTLEVDYGLGNKPNQLILSPVGNLDFKAGAYQLLSVEVDFYTGSTLRTTVPDSLYFENLDQSYNRAFVTYTFMSIVPESVRLCGYASVKTSSYKYDQFYCGSDTTVEIESTVSLDMQKVGDADEILQGETIDYTLSYTNTGDQTLGSVWIWDDVDPNTSIIETSVTPPPNTEESTEDTAAWYIGTINPDVSGSMSLTAQVDGNGTDISDGTLLINTASFGITRGDFPPEPALTSTYTTIVKAPVITIQKTDDLDFAVPGDTLTYIIQVENTGSVDAKDLVITDTLPALLNIDFALPAPTSQAGQTLVWNLVSLAAVNGSATITIQATLPWKAPNGTVLHNTASVAYQNMAGHDYTPIPAFDDTTVHAPVLTISKTGSPNPVLTGRELTYTLAYKNTGLSEAADVVITDSVPLNTTYESCTPSPCDEDGGVVSWEIASLASGASGFVQFSVIIDEEELQTGGKIFNDNYGIISKQTNYVAGTTVETTVNRDAAIVHGHAFIDVNRDGLLDPGEVILPDVAITLEAMTVFNTDTDDSGYYNFRVENESPAVITAEVPTGYFPTRPTTVYFDATLGVTETINFTYAPIDSSFGVITGIVFEDEDHDGVQELGETGLPNVSVESTAALISPVLTDKFGIYRFDYTNDGNVTITETNPPGYVSTTDDIRSAVVEVGSDGSSPVDFGDFYGIKIVGNVFEDLNVNASKDVDEPGLTGVGVTAGDDSTTTDVDGDFTLFTAVIHGSPISIEEGNPVGYVSTVAVPGNNMSVQDADTLVIGSPESGTVYTGLLFGDALETGVVTISGNVWNDNGEGTGILANGIQDSSEPWLAGAIVSLTTGMSQTTGTDGSFELFAPEKTAFTLIESNPPNYVSTNALPGDQYASKVDNDSFYFAGIDKGITSSGHLFGDVLQADVAIVKGTVYDDRNESGSLDIGEPGIANVLVTLRLFSGQQIAVYTGLDGTYQFALEAGQIIRITTSNPGFDYYPTSPNTLVFQPASGTNSGIDFGFSDDKDVAVIYGIAFNDIDSDGYQDNGELGLGGAEICLDDITCQTTVEDLLAGIFSFNVSTTSAYQITEENPEGYRSTTPDMLNVIVNTLGTSYFVDFGDTIEQSASVYGTVFDDVNANGVQDLGEGGLIGVEVSITDGLGGLITTTTEGYGQFTYGFTVTGDGIHTVTEDDPALPGYRSTTPDSINLDVDFGFSYIVNFGDTLNGFSTIMGTVFDDENGDSTQDHGELGIEGVTVSVGEVDLVTNNYGIFTIPINESDTYPIIEIDPDGYHSTTPNEVFVTVSVPKNTYIVNFGDSLNVAESSFFGAVFHDLNADTAHNPNEPYLEGVTVQMTRDGNLPVTFETNEWGQYTFLIDEAGVYAITETDPSGFVSTTAIPGTADVELINNNTFRLTVDETLIGVDFGNNLFGDVRLSDVVTISGIVWNDNGTGEGGLGDGTMDSEEPGLEGAVVSLSSGMSQITGVDGTFLLYAPAGEEVVLTESNPEEYVSMNAIPGLFGTYTDDDTISFAEMPAGTVSTENLFGDVIGADLQVVKTASSDTVVAGTELTYEIVVTNNGPASATGIEVMDDLPASLTLVSADPGEGEFDVDTNEWTIGSLEPGASATLTLVVLVDTDVTGDITNAVSVEGEQYDPDDGNNDDDLTTIVETEADLSITKTSLPDYVAHGAIVTYRLTFTNQGPSDALDLEITDTLPEALMNIDVVEQPDWLSGPTHIGQTMTWTAGELAAGSDGTIIINARMKPDAEGIIQNVATITSSTTDPVASNNSDTADTIIGLENTATIYGWVYEDLDEDMVRDDSEPGISGVTITLDGSENTQSGNDGLYVFFTEQDGDHTVVETDPDGYVSTTPNTAIRTAVLGESVRADFGDISGSCECTGDDYEDDDVDSAAVAAVFGVPQQYNFCDDFGDWIVFDVRHGHTYTITTNSIGVRADTSITLYDQDGTVLVSNDDLLGSDIFSSQIIWTAGTDGYVYVEFTNMADLCGCSTEYEVLVEESVGPFYLYLPLITEGSQPPSGQTILPEAIVSEPEVIHDTKGEITHICADDFEIDDEWWSTDVNTANNQILAGVEQSHSFDSNPQLYAADKDHLWFEILKGDTVNFTTTSKDGVIPFLELLDQKGDRIGVHGQDSLQWTATENGTYYLQVSPSGDEGTMSWGCYDIAGYDLLMTVNELLRLFLPLITQ